MLIMLGLPSKSLVYYSDSDRSLMEFLCSQTNPNLSEDENQRRTNVKLKAFRGPLISLFFII